MTIVFNAWTYGRFIEIQSNPRRKKVHRTNQGTILLELLLGIEIIEEPQSNLEEKIYPSILKDGFSSKADPPIFTSTAPVLLERPNKTSSEFQALKSKRYVLHQSTVSLRSDSSSEANSSCCHRPDAWSYWSLIVRALTSFHFHVF